MTDNLLTCDLEKSVLLSGPQASPCPSHKSSYNIDCRESLALGGEQTKLSKTSNEQPVTDQIVALKRRTLGLNFGAVCRGQEGYCYRTVLWVDVKNKGGAVS